MIQVVAFTITLTFAFTFTFTSNFMSTGRSFSPSTFTTRTQEGEEEEEPVDEFTCQFCGVRDTSFTEEKLDLHFWKVKAINQSINLTQALRRRSLTFTFGR